MAEADRLRGPHLAPELVQGPPHRPVVRPPRGRLLRQPSPAGRGGLRAGGPLPLGHREPRPPRARPRAARGRQPHPPQARRLRPPALVRAQRPARERGQQRERGGLRQRPQPRPAPGLRSPQVTELNSPDPEPRPKLWASNWTRFSIYLILMIHRETVVALNRSAVSGE